MTTDKVVSLGCKIKVSELLKNHKVVSLGSKIKVSELLKNHGEVSCYATYYGGRDHESVDIN